MVVWDVFHQQYHDPIDSVVPELELTCHVAWDASKTLRILSSLVVKSIPFIYDFFIPSGKPTWNLKNRPSQKETIVFQPSMFRCELFVSRGGGEGLHTLLKATKLSLLEAVSKLTPKGGLAVKSPASNPNFWASSNQLHGNLRGTPQCHPPKK